VPGCTVNWLGGLALLEITPRGGCCKEFGQKIRPFIHERRTVMYRCLQVMVLLVLIVFLHASMTETGYSNPQPDPKCVACACRDLFSVMEAKSGTLHWQFFKLKVGGADEKTQAYTSVYADPFFCQKGSAWTWDVVKTLTIFDGPATAPVCDPRGQSLTPIEVLKGNNKQSSTEDFQYFCAE
jgi:hypothetical protein